MDLQDYIHFYIGCDIQYPDMHREGKFIVAKLTGVSRADGIETTYKRAKDGCKGDYLSWKSNGHHNCDALHAKLVLTPISKVSEADHYNAPREDGYITTSAEICKYYCEKGYDVFGLIEAGLAIAKP